MPEKIIHASALALVKDGKVLLCSRPKGKANEGMLEFPGGKVEQGEMPSDALVREIKEELDISILISDLYPIDFTEYLYKDMFNVVLYLFLCENYEGEINPKENQSFDWYNIKTLSSIDNLVPADIKFITTLQNIVKQGK